LKISIFHNFVDVTTFNEGNVDVRSKVDELRFLRDQFIASLSVPPSFLGIEENLSNKCLDLATKIPLLSGKTVTIQELIQEFNSTGHIKDKETYSYDRQTGKIVAGRIVWAGITRKDTSVVKVTLDNGKYVIATPDHHFMLRNGEYIEARYLEKGDRLMPLYLLWCFDKTRVLRKLVYQPNSNAWQKTDEITNFHTIQNEKETNQVIFDEQAQLQHKVFSVEFLDYTIDTGDITIDKYHNFAVSSGVIISNSALTEENILFARAVIAHQKYLNHQLTDLLEKVFNLIDPENALTIFDRVSIGLPPPKSLQYEREARYLNDIISMITELERIGIPKEYAKRKYLSQFDWSEIEKYETGEKIDKTVGEKGPEEPDEGGF